MYLRLSQIILAIEAKRVGSLGSCLAEKQDFFCSQVAIDSRKVTSGAVFFCLKGKNHDSHDYAVQAVENGAAVLVVEREISVPDGTVVLQVDDTALALRQLACYWRQQTKAVVIGITGSAGKTTCKEILRSVLSRYGRVGQSYKNWNNQIGLPLSILAFDGAEDFWLVEVGISQARDMAELGETLLPDIAVILNAGICHSEGLGDLSAVSSAKASLLRWLSATGTAIVCADYPELAAAALLYRKKTVFFSGRKTDTDFFTQSVRTEKNGSYYVLGSAKGESLEVFMTGQELLETLAGVFATVNILGLDIHNGLAQGLLDFQPVADRFGVRELGGWKIINDTYNANPLSMRQAVRTAKNLARGENFVCVLGKMGELGEFSHDEHRRLGEELGLYGVQKVFFYGAEEADFVRLGLNEKSSIFENLSTEEAFRERLAQLCLPSGVILFKGSRSCEMERFMRVFLEFLQK